MSDLFANISMESGFAVPITVFIASLLGSTHCAAMCGPIVAKFSPGLGARMIVYHLGRLLSYIGLGALAGSLGETLFVFRNLSLVASWGLAFFFIWSGYCLWKGKREFTIFPKWIARMVERPLARLVSLPNGNSLQLFAIGILTALLPCGWLHTFVAAAVTTGSARQGAIVLFAFWLGTVPGLTAGVSLVRGVLSPVGRRYPSLVSVVLLLAAIFTVSIRLMPLPGGSHGSHSGCAVKTEKPVVPESSKKEVRY